MRQFPTDCADVPTFHPDVMYVSYHLDPGWTADQVGGLDRGGWPAAETSGGLKISGGNGIFNVSIDWVNRFVSNSRT